MPGIGAPEGAHGSRVREVAAGANDKLGEALAPIGGDVAADGWR
jgi:hypothetical protein